MGRKKGNFDQIKYNNEYAKENYARLSVLVPKQAKEPILTHLAQKGFESISSYLSSLIARDLGLTDLSELVGGGGQKSEE